MATALNRNNNKIVLICVVFQTTFVLFYFISLFSNFTNDTIVNNTHDDVPFTQGMQWQIHNDSNPRYISVHSVKQLTIKIALFCIGAQAAGTTSMIVQLAQIPQVVTPKSEMHWYSQYCWWTNHGITQRVTAAVFKYNISASDEMNIWHDYCPIDGFISRSMMEKTITGKRTEGLCAENITYYAAKGPREILFPHIANLYINYFVKYYGTKLLLLLRDPVKRCISGLVKFVFQSTNHTKHSIIEWLNENSLAQQFNKSLTKIYAQHVNDSSDNIWNDVRSEYRYFFYNQLLPNLYWKDQWLRSCYLPQIVSWTYYLEQLNIWHSFKILQMEQLHRSPEDFQQSMNYLRCYIHSTEHDYEQGMNQCMNITQLHFTPVHTGKKTGSFIATEQEIQALRISFSMCNNLLYQFLASHKYSSSILLTKQWDWKLWNLSY